MSREKSGDPARGRPIRLPPWWLEELAKLCGDRSAAEIADALAGATRRDQRWSRQAVQDFRSGKVTTDRLMDDFLTLFPELPPPLFYASSLEEAQLYRQLSKLRQQEQPGASAAAVAPDRDATTLVETAEVGRTSGSKRRRRAS